MMIVMMIEILNMMMVTMMVKRMTMTMIKMMMMMSVMVTMGVGSFSNDNSDGYENVKTAIGLLNETSSLHMYTFLYISLPLLHD